MANLTITATSVKQSTNAKVQTRYALETITAGQTVYESTTDTTKVGLFDADVAGKGALKGVALNGASIDQPVLVQTEGDIIIGATVAVGVIYTGSDTAGGIRPSADNNAGDTIAILGVAKSATTITIDIQNTGITMA